VNPSWSKDRRRELRVNETLAEGFLWSHLRDRRCGGIKFRRQVGIGPYIADFYASESKLVVELDGPIHDTFEARAYDLERERYFKELGIRTLRFKNEDISVSMEEIVKKILALAVAP